MAILGSHGIMLVDAIPTYTPAATQAKLARLENTLTLYYYNGAAWTAIDLDALAAVAGDGNDTAVVAADAIAGVAPTAGQVPSPISGDTASKYLTDGQLEKWVYNGTVWALAYTLAASQATNLGFTGAAGQTTITSSSGIDAVIPEATDAQAGVMSAALFQDLADAIALSGVAGNSTDFGAAFIGSTIADGSTILSALQALETALEAGAFSVTDTASVDLTKTGDAISADVKLAAAQDNHLSVSISADGLRVTKVAVSAYASHAAADADAGLVAGSSYVLTVINIEGVSTDGTSAPVFVK